MRDKKGGWEIKTMEHNNSQGKKNDVSRRKEGKRVENSNEAPDEGEGNDLRE